MRILVVIAAILSMPAVAMACDADAFLKKAAVLKPTDPPFMVNKVYPDYRRPQPDDNQIDNDILDLLRQAFEISPRFFQTHLCELDGFYIVSKAAWGYREHPPMFPEGAQPDRYQKYLGLPEGYPPNYSVYETMVANSLLPGLDIKVTLSPDTPAMSVLAVIAHEVGHIRFRMIHTPVPGAKFEFDRFCDGSYFNRSWQSPVDVQPARGADAIAQSPHLADDVQIADIRAMIKTDKPKAGKMLATMLRSHRWVDIHGSFSPEHDWVEVYKMNVLTHTQPPLDTMRVEIPTGRKHVVVDLIEQLKQPTEIASKIGCFARLFGE